MPEEKEPSSLKGTEKVLRFNDPDELHKKAVKIGRQMAEMRSDTDKPPKPPTNEELPSLIDEHRPIVRERYKGIFKRKPPTDQ